MIKTLLTDEEEIAEFIKKQQEKVADLTDELVEVQMGVDDTQNDW